MTNEEEMPLEAALQFVQNAIEKNRGLVLLTAYNGDGGVHVHAKLREIPGHHVLLLAADLWNHIAEDSGHPVLQLMGKALSDMANRVSEVEPGRLN